MSTTAPRFAVTDDYIASADLHAAANEERPLLIREGTGAISIAMPSA